MQIFYKIFWFGVSLLSAPLIVWRLISRPEFREDFAERLGIYPEDNNFKQMNPVWFHAASVGEVNGIKPVIERLSELDKDLPIIITTTTINGKKAALKISNIKSALLLPLDIPFIVKRFLKYLNPRVAIFNETEVWPNLLLALNALGTKTIIINGRISDLSYPNYSRFKILFNPIIGSINKIFAQTKLDADRFRSLGAKKEAVIVTGSTKYEQGLLELNQSEKISFLEELKIPLDANVFVAGSVREQEDLEIIYVFSEIVKKFPNLKLIIAPRHMKQVEAIKEKCLGLGLTWIFRTKPSEVNASVVILDTIGELTRCYAVATICFIGGSLINIGGHNPVEAMQYGVPVIIGRHYFNVREVIDLMKAKKGVFIVSSKEELMISIEKLLEDENLFNHFKKTSLEINEKLKGVSARVAVELLN